MTEILEKVTIPETGNMQEKCPFCGKDIHPFASRKGDPNEKIVSRPSELGELPLEGQGPGRWGRARHHIIPAMQCFAKVRRLARMAMSVGYDINDPVNGIALPTIKNKYRFPPGGSTHDAVGPPPCNFGELTDPQKEETAFWVMNQLKMQWHVGNHHYNTEPEEPSDMLDEGKLTHQPYDVNVIDRLLQELRVWVRNEYCKKEDDLSDEIKNAMKRVSDEIREKLDAFRENAEDSSPFFVSEVSLKYARKH